MITITILDEHRPPSFNTLRLRMALVDIAQDGGPTYRLRVGGIPDDVNVQQHLDSRADELWQLAQQRGELSDGREPRVKAIAALQQIRDNIDGSTAAQKETAIKRIATILQKLLEQQ